MVQCWGRYVNSPSSLLSELFNGYTSADFAISDLNNDSTPDLLGLKGAWLNQGENDFNKIDIPIFQGQKLKLADLEGDGDPDVLWLNRNSELSLWENDELTFNRVLSQNYPGEA